MKYMFVTSAYDYDIQEIFMTSIFKGYSYYKLTSFEFFVIASGEVSSHTTELLLTQEYTVCLVEGYINTKILSEAQNKGAYLRKFITSFDKAYIKTDQDEYRIYRTENDKIYKEGIATLKECLADIKQNPKATNKIFDTDLVRI